MKFLFITNNLDGKDGYSTYARNLIESLQNKRHEVTVVHAPNNESNLLVSEAVLLNPNMYRYFWNVKEIYTTAIKIQKVIDAYSPDVIHITAEPYQQILNFIKLPRTTKVILTVHGTYAFLPDMVSSLVGRQVCKCLYFSAQRKIDCIISVSEFTRQKLMQKNKYAEKTVVIHNSTQYKPQTNTKDINIDEYAVLTVGAVKPRKGMVEAVKALSLWAALQRKKVTYYVAGFFDPDDPYLRELQMVIKEKENAYFTTMLMGSVSKKEKDELYRKVNLYIHLEPVGQKNFEGFGIGMIDAAAHGVPSIVSRNTATAEAIVRGKTGYEVDVNNQDEVQERLTDVLLCKKIDESDILEWAESHQPESILDLYLSTIHGIQQ